MQDDPQAANEIGSHIYYLADKGYVKCYLGDEVLSLVQDPPREALVRLTAKGIDLMEGTLDDEGVAFGDPMLPVRDGTQAGAHADRQPHGRAAGRHPCSGRKYAAG